MKRRNFFQTILGAAATAKAAPKLKPTASDLALNLNRTNLSMVGHGLTYPPLDCPPLRKICPKTAVGITESASDFHSWCQPPNYTYTQKNRCAPRICFFG